MAKKPIKFRQARKDAKAAAKKAFPGKVKARRRDPKIKVSAEDRKVLSEVANESRRGYITDDRGNRVNVKPVETARERIARENAEAMRQFRERVEAEDGPKQEEPKKAAKKAAVKKAAVKKAVVKKAAAKPAVKKAAAKKAAFKPSKTFGQVSNAVAEATAPTGEKKMTRAERSAANKARWKSMTPAERKNWKASQAGTTTAKNEAAKPETKKAEVKKPAVKKAAAPKPAATPKRPTLAPLKKNEAKALAEAKARVEARKAGAGAKPRGMKSGEKPGQQPAAKAKPSVKPAAVSKGSKLLRKVKGAGKLGIVGALAAETYGLASGSTADNVREIQRLENKLASLTGKRDSAGKTFVKGMGLEVGQLANLSTLGIVGKNRRQRMDELNALIAKEQAKQAKAQAKANAKLRYGPGGESLVPGTAAYKAGSKTRPTKAQVAANFQAAKGSTTGGATGGAGTGGAGSTIKVTPGSSYTVKKGDTLSAIAKSAGVSLADLRAANKKFKTNPKYKQGSMIFSGTTVKIPKKK